MKGLLNRMVKVGMPDEPPVHKKILLSTGLAGKGRLADKAPDVGNA